MLIKIVLFLGSSILVRPVTEPGVSSINVYFPGGVETTWYDIDDYKPYPGAGSVSIPVNLDKVNL